MTGSTGMHLLNGHSLKIQPLGKFQGNIIPAGWHPPHPQKPKPPINPLERAARESEERDQTDFTNDVAVESFSSTSSGKSTIPANLNSYVMNLLHSIEDHGPMDASNSPEEGEYEEPEDFPSQLAQYHKDLEAFYTYVPSNAANASQSNAKHISPDASETTRNLKQALQEIRHRESQGNQMSSQHAGRIAEQTATRMTSSTSAISAREAERRSPPEQVRISYNPSDRRLSVAKQERQSPNKQTLSDSEWRREIRMVETTERGNEQQAPREREGRPPTRSDSGSRSHSPWRKQARSPPIRRRSRSRSVGRRRSRTRSPPLRRGRSRTPPRWRRSRSPVHRVSRSPVRRAVWSPVRGRSPSRRRSRSPLRRESRSPVRRGRSRTPFNALDRKVVVRRSRSPHRALSPPRKARSPSPGAKFREGLVAIQNGTKPIQKPVVSKHFPSAIPSIPTPSPNALAGANHALHKPPAVPANFPATFAPQPVPVHPVVPLHVVNHPGYYGQPVPAAQIMHPLPPQLLHQQVLAQQILQQQMMQREQLGDRLQQQLLQYQQLQQQQQQAKAKETTSSPDPPVGTSTDESQSVKASRPSDSPQSSSVAVQRDEVALLEQRLRAQRDSKLEKQLNLIHQLLMLRFQQADSEQKQKVAGTEVERERLSLSIMEKAKLEKEMASSAQAMEKFIQHATAQLGEDLEKLKQEKSERLYRFYDPQQHWCELCDVVCEKLHDYLNHLHSKKHEQMLESTGVPSMPWHDKQKPEEDGQAGKEGLIANRVPFAGLQSLQPVKAWYCKMCDEWMGDVHCAQLHMTSTKHNNAFLKLTMERPDPGFLYAVRKQSALKRSVARKKEEEKAKETAKKRKLEVELEARKRKKPDESEEEKRQAGQNGEDLREDFTRGAMERDTEERNTELQVQESTDNSNTLTSESTETCTRSTQSEQAYSKDTENGSEVSQSSSEPSTESSAVSLQSKKLAIVERIKSCASNFASEEASTERLQEGPPDGSEEEIESLEKISAFVNAELRVSPNLEAHRVNEPQGDADKSGSSKDGSHFYTNNGVRGQEKTLPAREERLPISSNNSHHRGKSDSEEGAAKENIMESLSIGSQQANSGFPSNGDENISPDGGEKAVDSADSPADGSPQRESVGNSKETLHSTPLQLLPPPLIPIKSEPEEPCPVKTEPRDFSETVERPVALVKSEPVTSTNQPESRPVELSSVGSNVVIKKEGHAEQKVGLPAEDKVAEPQIKKNDDSDSDDCCIIEEVDGRSGKVFDTVDLESNASAPVRRESASSALGSEAPDDAPDSEVSVQLSDYIVLSETGDGDEMEKNGDN